MLKERAREISLVVAGLDLILLVVSFLAAYSVRAHILPGYFAPLEYVEITGYLWLLFVSIPLFHLLFRSFRLYDSMRTMSTRATLIAVTKPFLVASLSLGSLIFLIQAKTFSRSIFLAFLGIYYLLVLLEKCWIRSLQKQVRRRGYNYRNILIVGVGPEATQVAAVLNRHEHLGMRVIGHLRVSDDSRAPNLGSPILGMASQLPSLLDDRVVDEVCFAVSARELLDLEPLIWKCEEVGVRVHLKADFINTILSRTYSSDIEGIPILTLSSTPHAAGPIVIKRCMDIVLSSLGFVLLSPLFLLIATLVRLTSPGPILYRQSRAGLNGRRFVMLKFRTMYRDAEVKRAALATLNEMSGPVFKMAGDPRVTPLGRLIRRYSLDELPQLWNVWTGDMSLVGPRPPLPAEVDQYIRWQRRRLSMKPGLTCLWQVNGRNDVQFSEWMRLDMHYIDHWSLSLDMKILLKTIPAVLTARGAR